MQIERCAKNRVRYFYLAFGVVGLFVLGIASCNSPERRPFSKTSKSSVGWPRGVVRWREAEYPVLKVELPKVEGAEFVNDDSLCATCHETYVKKFEADVHREQKCEGCHGPASRHLQTRGKEPGLILSLKSLPVAQRSEVCLKCHEKPHEPGERWRTSVHAHKGVTCTDCHQGHYNVPPGTPATEVAGTAAPKTDRAAANGAGEAGGLVAARRSDVSDLLRLVSETRPRATASPPVLSLKGAVVRAQEPSEKISLRGTSNHMGAVAPQVCYKCHAEMRDLEQIAQPHQVGGRNGFNCTTCHDTHGKILEHTRKDLCLECHKGAPTMAWHSSTHNLHDVACTDCHNPHPKSNVPEFVNINHTNVDRPKRLPMSVDEPEACYKCHQKMYGMNALPSHHPIKEGKMVCSSCHDGHGQARCNLKEVGTANMVCYRCHADKQGPFAYEHPPVTENCMICHEPHGTVANNLLRQPPTFLCLRCHSGHRTSPVGPDHAPLLGDVGTSPALQRAFYSNCTQCHSQIHGSDLPTPHVPRAFMR
ncbi:MAG: hypothetical protein HY000_24250 [Planctomycetes bacterium]|nr:hypothetical protein [Planctomycetota bacterium]